MTREELQGYLEKLQKAEEYADMYERAVDLKDNVEFCLDGFLWLTE